MRCGKVRKLSFMFYEESLPKEKMEDIREHLKECPWCASEYKKVRRMMNSIESESPKVVPSELHKNIMTEVNGMKSFDEEERREYKIATVNALRKTAVALAAIFIVAFSLSFVDFKNIDINKFGEVLKFESKDSSINDEINDKSLKVDELFGIKKSNDKKYSASSVSNDAGVEPEEEAAEISEEENLTMIRVTGEESAKEYKVLDEDVTAVYDTLDEDAGDKTNKDIISEKGFANIDDYAELLETDDSITKKGLIKLYTPTFDKSINDLEKACDKYNANIYYSNIYLEDGVTIKGRDDYRTALIALRVLGDNYNNLKEEIEKLGTYDINVMQDELKIETEEDIKLLLSNVKEQLLTHKNKLDELDEDSDTYESDKNELNETIASEEKAVENLEAKLEAMSENIEVVKLELTLKEISEEDLEGMLSGKTFGESIKRNFINGWDSFVRMLQNIFLWITENILFIIFFIILFLIVFVILKALFLRNRE